MYQICKVFINLNSVHLRIMGIQITVQSFVHIPVFLQKQETDDTGYATSLFCSDYGQFLCCGKKSNEIQVRKNEISFLYLLRI